MGFEEQHALRLEIWYIIPVRNYRHKHLNLNMDKAMDDKPDIVTLLDRFQKRFPTEWREDRWYLTAVRKTTHKAYLVPPSPAKKTR